MPTFNVELTAAVVCVVSALVYCFILGHKSVSKREMDEKFESFERNMVSRIDAKASQKETKAHVEGIHDDISKLTDEIGNVEKRLRDDLHGVQADIRQVRDWLMEKKEN